MSPAPRRHHLDHASTTSLRDVARAAMLDVFDTPYGDPGRRHRSGGEARIRLEQARDDIAEFVGASNREVVLTGGATEAIAHAAYGTRGRGDVAVVSAVEHRAVLANAEAWNAVEVLEVDKQGLVRGEVLGALLDDIRASGRSVAAVHVQAANPDTGVVQPVAELARVCQDASTLFHVDAAATGGYLGLETRALGIDLLSLSSHKLGGPTGIGALVVRRGLRIESLLRGAAQERGRRAGMEHLAGAAGFAAALRELRTTRTETIRTLSALRERVEEAAIRWGARVVGSGAARLPHITALEFDDVAPQAIVAELDRRGIEIHSGSSCGSEEFEPSPAVLAMGIDAERVVRVSLGWDSDHTDVDAFIEHTPHVLAELRGLRSR